jgi:ketosteroid isomerase-like protein
MTVAANGLANRPAAPVPAAVSKPAAPELVHVKPGVPMAAAGGAASVPAKQLAAPAAPAAPAVQLAKAEPTKTDATDKADSSKADINKAVDQWAKAWSAQDMKGYLNAYGSSFQPPRGQSRQAWAAERSARIEGKEHIKVSVEAPQIVVNGNTATVKFRQIYVSDRLKANSRKTLVMEKQGNKWVIKQEQSGG